MDNRKLQIEHLDSKMAVFVPASEIAPPQKGWVHAIRTSIRMSLRQLGGRMGITPQSANEIELREAAGSITLNTLRDAASAIDMQLVYGFVPRDGSLEEAVARQARRVAEEIVRRTSTSMRLEDQENTEERLERAIAEKTDDLIREMPRHLWD